MSEASMPFKTKKNTMNNEDMVIGQRVHLGSYMEKIHDPPWTRYDHISGHLEDYQNLQRKCHNAPTM